MPQPHCANGYVTLLSVLVLGAVATAITVSMLLLSVGSSRTSVTVTESLQARGLANACAEEAIQKLRESVYYTGNETLTMTDGTCVIETIAGTGNVNRTIQTIGTVGTVSRKVRVIVATVHPTIVVNSWQEVNDF